MADDYFIEDHLSSACYSKCIELSVAIRDMEREYYVGPKWTLFSSNSLTGHMIKVSWKPPGSLQWVEKFSTEPLSGYRELEYAQKAYFDVELDSLTGIKLNLEFIKVSSICAHGTWSTIETNLEKCVKAEGGLILPVPLQFGLDEIRLPKYLQDSLHMQMRGAPEFVALVEIKTEFVKPQSMEKLGMKFFPTLRKFTNNGCGGNRFQPFLPMVNPTSSPFGKRYCIEIYKMDRMLPSTSCSQQIQANNNDDPQRRHSMPFTLIFRHIPSSTIPCSFFYVNESKCTNSDVSRVFKIVIVKRRSKRKKSFAIFSLESILGPQKQDILNLPLQVVDGIGWSKGCAVLNLCNCVNYRSYDDYLRLGLKFVRIYAVDYSESTWDHNFHCGDCLHLPQTSSNKSTFEEALAHLIPLYEGLGSVDSFVYGFGFPHEPREFTSCNVITEFDPDFGQHYHSVLACYRETLHTVQLSRQKFQRSLEVSSSRGENPPIKKPQKKCLTPILKQILTLISSQPVHQLGINMKYFVAFILTDGQFSDFHKACEVMVQLSHFGVSLIFIGLGNGDLSALQELCEPSLGPGGGSGDHDRVRTNAALIHFRSWVKWRSALLFYKTRTPPDILFRKEVCSAVREQAVAYFRLNHPSL